MFRKIMAIMLIGVFCFSTMVSAAGSSDMTLLEKISSTEKALYGSVQTGAILDRLNQTELDLYGVSSLKNESLQERADRNHAAVFSNTESKPSLTVKMNAVEWSICHEVSAEPLKKRLENVESMVEGAPANGSINSRLDKLCAMAFAQGTITAMETELPANTLIKVRFLQDISTKEVKVGDRIDYKVAEDVILNGNLVLVKGANGFGKVTKVRAARNFGRDGKLEIDFDHTFAIDGEPVATFLGEEAKDKAESMAVTAGATVAGMVILGPVGAVTGAFIKGKDVNIPAGSETYVQTQTALHIWGLQVQ